MGNSKKKIRFCDTISSPMLAFQINMAIKSLGERGITIRDFDDKGRIVRGIKVIGGRYYFLATKEPTEVKNHGLEQSD